MFIENYCETTLHCKLQYPLPKVKISNHFLLTEYKCTITSFPLALKTLTLRHQDGKLSLSLFKCIWSSVKTNQHVLFGFLFVFVFCQTQKIRFDFVFFIIMKCKATAEVLQDAYTAASSGWSALSTGTKRNDTTLYYQSIRHSAVCGKHRL